MPGPSILPASDSDFLTWHDNFLSVLIAMKDEINIPNEMVEKMKTGNAKMHEKLAQVNLKIVEHKNATAEKNDARNELDSDTRGVIRLIKALPGHTPAQGKKFGIDNTAKPIDLVNAKPKLMGKDLTDGKVELRFNKSNYDGVNIYSQREGDTEWVLISRANVSPFSDPRALLAPGKPELRRYSTIYVYKDAEIGKYSDEIIVNCTP